MTFEPTDEQIEHAQDFFIALAFREVVKKTSENGKKPYFKKALSGTMKSLHA